MIRPKSEDRIAFFSAVIMGFLCHGYAMVNKITNHDDMMALVGFEDGISNGRWMWSLVKAFNLANSPWLFGLINIFLMALCVVLIVRVFSLKNLWTICILAGLWVSSPANTTVIFYLKWVPSYAIGCVLAVFALLCFANSQKKKIWYFAGCLSIALSLASYQAYFPITAAGLVMILICDILNGQMTFSKLIVKCFSALFMLILGLVLYMGLTRIIQDNCNISMISYQGLDKIGVPAFGELIYQIKQAYRTLFNFNKNIKLNSLTRVLDIVLPICYITEIFFLTIRLLRKRMYLMAVSLLVLATIYPVACNLIYLFGADYIHSLMQYGYVFLPLSLAILGEKNLKLVATKEPYINFAYKGICLILLLLIIYDGNMANEEFYLGKQTQEFVFDYFQKISVKVEEVDGFTQETPVALVGRCNDPIIGIFDASLGRANLGGNSSAEAFTTVIISYDWIRPNALMYYSSFWGNLLSLEQSMELLKDTRVLAMPDYPAKGSIAMIDGVIVVHFSSTF